jgi:hypothetical protein
MVTQHVSQFVDGLFDQHREVARGDVRSFVFSCQASISVLAPESSPIFPGPKPSETHFAAPQSWRQLVLLEALSTQDYLRLVVVALIYIQVYIQIGCHVFQPSKYGRG